MRGAISEARDEQITKARTRTMASVHGGVLLLVFVFNSDEARARQRFGITSSTMSMFPYAEFASSLPRMNRIDSQRATHTRLRSREERWGRRGWWR